MSCLSGRDRLYLFHDLSVAEMLFQKTTSTPNQPTRKHTLKVCSLCITQLYATRKFVKVWLWASKSQSKFRNKCVSWSVWKGGRPRGGSQVGDGRGDPGPNGDRVFHNNDANETPKGPPPVSTAGPKKCWICFQNTFLARNSTQPGGNW